MAYPQTSGGGIHPNPSKAMKIMPWTMLRPGHYLISCSRLRNKSESKKSKIVISSPSQSFLIVATVVLLLRPLTILFTVDCVTPLRLDRALMEIFRSWHKPKILCRTASPTVISQHLFLWKYVKKEYTKPLVKITPFELILT